MPLPSRSSSKRRSNVIPGCDWNEDDGDGPRSAFVGIGRRQASILAFCSTAKRIRTDTLPAAAAPPETPPSPTPSSLLDVRTPPTGSESVATGTPPSPSHVAGEGAGAILLPRGTERAAIGEPSGIISEPSFSTPSHPRAPSASRTPAQPSKKSKTKKKSHQMCLDFGQRGLGRRATTCPDCGMMYQPGMPNDERAHARACSDIQLGVPFASSKHVRYVADHIVLIRPSDPAPLQAKLRQLHEQVIRRELGFVEEARGGAKPSNNNNSSSKNIATFLYVASKRIVGMVVVHEQMVGYAICEDDVTSRSTTEPRRCLLGIHQLWTHADHRSRGIATRLVDAARSHYHFGMVIPRDRVAFSSPTTDGMKFAKKYCGDDNPVLVYDFV